VKWPKGDAKPTLAFDKHVMTGRAEVASDPETMSTRLDKQTFQSEVEKTICNCWNRIHGGLRQTWDKGDIFECPGAYGAADAACVARYPIGGSVENSRVFKKLPADYTDAQRGKCEQQLACIRRDPASPP
jgi:hypothetical protein